MAWHQDGTTHWDAPDWDPDAHGFNFMAQLYPSTPGNGVWVLPGSHRLGRVDIKRLTTESGSERITGAVPLICDSGDVIMTNRQLVHGSFANSSPDRRVTVNAGFFARKRVLGVTTELLSGEEVTFDEARLKERSRMISVDIDARRQRFPDESSYIYRPGIGQEDENRWCEDTRRSIVRNYNLRDMYI
ncbi:MAG: phytanoyl-CoA dioxygenase family protein [Minwuia sp.]|nr:phytanoyl-CoA dioxygenase family protein [Minwuia sp.]